MLNDVASIIVNAYKRFACHEHANFKGVDQHSQSATGSHGYTIRNPKRATSTAITSNNLLLPVLTYNN